jgi:hypothetical protein
MQIEFARTKEEFVKAKGKGFDPAFRPRTER